jgi:hypothetical protein
MPPTDLPPPRPANAKPPDCTITEERGSEGERFRIPPGRDVVPLGGLLFVAGWAAFWTLAIAYYLFVPSDHGRAFTFFAILLALFGEYFSLTILGYAAMARFAVETIRLGPDGIARELRVGPLRLTRRVDLGAARSFRLETFPGSISGKGPRRWTAHLFLQRLAGSPLRCAEGARDVDKPWLADRLNEELRALQEARGD